LDRDWLEAESQRRGGTPREQLRAIFDVFGEWFARPDFEGCAFLTTMIEVNDRENPVHQAAGDHDEKSQQRRNAPGISYRQHPRRSDASE
jgi:hypothetical protein